MQQRDHTGITPSSGNLFEIVLEVAKNDVTVTVNQGGNRHKDLKRAFRSIVPVARERTLNVQPAAAGSIAFLTAALKRDF